MKLSQALQKVKIIRYLADAPPVLRTTAGELALRLSPSPVQTEAVSTLKPDEGVLLMAIYDSRVAELQRQIDGTEDFIHFQISEDGGGCLLVSKPHFLFWFAGLLFDYLADEEVDVYRSGKTFHPSFKWQRISYDFFLTQEGRIQTGLNKVTYLRELARLGFTHVEVNALAFPMGLETGPKGEAYPMFYTYCPALDQFVCSELNKGLYPTYYLSANLASLKENARLALKYGLTPGLLCFEPRSVPEEFFTRYPMLRGARVDHPFRSFKPRYNMTIAHPRVREHYAEMMRKLMREVPELGFLSIWTNDSGSGFEHTRSLYVGRNGGAYLIREWVDDEAIARCAGENALRFFRTLRDAAQEVNPEFRVITRLESFYGEHATVWNGLGKQIDVESASLVAKGWEMPYRHPTYPDSRAVNAGSVYQQKFFKKEGLLHDELNAKNARAHFYFAAGPNTIFAPLLGVPYPKLTYQRLRLLYKNGVTNLAHSGGTAPPELVPFNINHEICRRFQLNPDMHIRGTIGSIARKWSGEKYYTSVVAAWEKTEGAILAFPNITPLYSSYGFSWYRLWVRPFVPNIEAIAQKEREHYENFMCTTPHNPNNVDLSRDVLFQLTTPEQCQRDLERMDRNLWEPLDAAISILAGIDYLAQRDLGAGNIIHDQYIRLQALKCWFRTQHSVAVWIAAVHGYLRSVTQSEKVKHRRALREMMLREIENTGRLRLLWDSGVEFMATTAMGETPLIHGRNLKELWEKRVRIMRAHMDDEPYIDDNYIDRKAGESSR